MGFKWIQLQSNMGDGEHWVLISENREIVVDVRFSEHGEHWQNHRLRRKMKHLYEQYFMSVWTRKLTF
jgi:hypothetical protein